MRPNVGAVVGNVNRNVAHNADPEATAVALDLLPLPEKFKLRELVKFDLGEKFLPPFPHGTGIPFPQSRIPVHPDGVAEESFARHEERIIFQPASVSPAEGVKGGAIGVSGIRRRSLSGPAEQAVLKVNYATVLDALFGKLGSIRKILRREKTLVPQCS